MSDQDTVLEQALECFDVQLVAEMDGFGNNDVYECQRRGQACILKICDGTRPAQMPSESALAFVLFLAGRGLPVARPLVSTRGLYIEIIDNDRSAPRLATLTEKAGGQVLPDEDEIHLPEAKLNQLLVEWGRLAGRLHRATKDYRPPLPQLKRIEWYEESEVWDFEKHLPTDQALVKVKAAALHQKFAAFPTTPDCYGLIHCDLHHGNFTIDEHGQLTLFDFDGCMYHWFALDIASALYNALPCPASRAAERQAFTARFMQHFMAGYSSENQLDPLWIARLPDFLKYEQIADYVIYHQLWDIAHLTPRQEALLRYYREAIEGDMPVVEYDFIR